MILAAPPKASPELLTVQWFKDEDWPVVDQCNGGVNTRYSRDFMGIIDVLAMLPSIDLDTTVVAVQSTSAAHVSERVKKIAESEGIERLRRADVKVLVHGWSRVPKTKLAKMDPPPKGMVWWQCRVVDVS